MTRNTLDKKNARGFKAKNVGRFAAAVGLNGSGSLPVGTSKGIRAYVAVFGA
ncbi:hypothetical protein [Paenibacillus validus]|uniref:hypothetical protein n=1 Tax=Paenibacillus validus TaxID=44253 RepID=UPI003D2D24E6